MRSRVLRWSKRIICFTFLLLISIAEPVHAADYDYVLDVGQNIKIAPENKYKGKAKLVLKKGKSVKIKGYKVTAVKKGISVCDLVFSGGSRVRDITIKVVKCDHDAKVKYKAKEGKNGILTITVENKTKCFANMGANLYDKDGHLLISFETCLNENAIFECTPEDLGGNSLDDIMIEVYREFPKDTEIETFWGKPDIEIGI